MHSVSKNNNSITANLATAGAKSITFADASVISYVSLWFMYQKHWGSN